MLLSSSAYFIFLVAIFALYWPVSRLRTVTLAVVLFANYFFYAKWSLIYLALIPALSTLDYTFGLGLQSSKNAAIRRTLVSLSILMNVGALAAIRYLHLPLPVTLSFYVFQALTYTIDLYRRDAKGTRSYLAHLASVSFFPTTLAGPITRVSSLIEQFEKPKKLDPADGGRALFLIGMGLTKKLMIADFLSANLVNRVFDFPNLYSGTEVLVAVYAYALQIYYDFSGYTDIAIGSAMLLGIRLPVNFNRPYAAENIADFWRRWHITLSNWLRDYLFFSLPGKRSKTMVYLNLIVTMVIGGIWHGATWNFAIWGLLHGVGLAVVRYWQTSRKGAVKTPLVRIACIFGTFHFVTLAWIFFRAPNLETAWTILARIASLSASAANLSGPIALIMAIGILAHYMPKKWYDTSVAMFTRAPFFAQAAALALLVIGLQYVAQTGATPFIYNKF